MARLRPLPAPDPELDEIIGLRSSGAPLSELAETLEARVAGYDSRAEMLRDFNGLFGAASPQTSPIPAKVLAQYRLAEYYLSTEGDLYHAIEVPIEIGGQDLVVEHRDPGERRRWEELYAETEMEETVQELMRSVSVYGVACPFVVFDRRRSKTASVTLFDPKTVQIGRLPIGGFSGTLIGQPARSLNDILDNLQRDRPLAYRGLTTLIRTGDTIAIPPTAMKLIRAKALPWENYPGPPIRRAFRTLSTRQVLEEMIRATIEGYKNQLWHVAVGTPEMPARPGELARIANELAGNRGERAGVLVTRGNVRLTVHSPTLDSVLFNEKWLELTYHLFRQLGISLRVISGESVRGVRDPLAVDVSVFVSRVEWLRNRILAWLRWFNQRYAGRTNPLDPALPTVRFKKTALQIENDVKNRLIPLLTVGLLSDTTALEEAGYDYDTQLANKEAEAPNRAMFLPKPQFNQIVSAPTGEPAAEHLSPPGGRPGTGVPERRGGTRPRKEG